MSQFSNRLDQLLYERKLKRSDLVRGTGIPESSIRGWRDRGSMPAADVAVNVARFLGVSVEYLMTGEGDNSNINSLEFELLDTYRRLDERDKNTLLAVARSLIAQYSAEEGLQASSV